MSSGSKLTTDVASQSTDPIAAPSGGPPSAIGRVELEPLRPSTWGWFLALVAWTILMSFYGIAGGAGLEPVDCWVTQTAREMYENVQTQGWRGLATPYFSEELFLQKSVGPYWAVCLTAWLRGTEVDVVAARVPGAIAAVALMMTLFWLARRIAGDRAAIFAGFTGACSAGLLYWSHRTSADLGVTTLMTMSLACLWVASESEPAGWKRVVLWMLGYFFAGLAMIYKMPMPLVCVGLPALLYVLLRKRWRIFASPWHLLGLALFLLPWLPWALWMFSEIPIVAEKWRTEFWDRITGDLPNVAAQFSWYFYFMYLGVALVLAIPFSLSVPKAIARAFRRAPGVDRNGQWFLLIWFFSLLVFFTISIGKETRYLWPAMPPLFILLGIELAGFFGPQRRWPAWTERLGFWSIVILVPVGLAACLFMLRTVWEKAFPEGEYAWRDVFTPALVAAVIFGGGVIVSAGLYRRRRSNESFAALVGTTWLTWLWVWPTLMPILGSQLPSLDYAEQLAALSAEQRGYLRQVGHHDPRIIWYSDVRYPRLINQLEMLRMQGGKRNFEWEQRYYIEKMAEALGSDEPILLAISPGHYARFLTKAPLVLAEQGKALPQMHVWLQARKGRVDHQHILFGNTPPPWPEPEVRLTENQTAQIREAAQRAAALLTGGSRAATAPANP